jgi:hypothetical protein
MRPVPRSPLLLVVLIASTFACAKQQTVSGHIVAYDTPLVCLNGNVYQTIIIRVEHPKKVGSEFILAEFSHPCDAAPKWLSARSRIQEFRLIREEEKDGALKEFMDCVDESGAKHPTGLCSIPIWKPTSGAEKESLPFGRRLPCYRFADLPLVPVV